MNSYFNPKKKYGDELKFQHCAFEEALMITVDQIKLKDNGTIVSLQI